MMGPLMYSGCMGVCIPVVALLAAVSVCTNHT